MSASEASHQNLNYDLVVVVSQSGETKDVLEFLRKIKPKKIFTIGISNSKNSLLSRLADFNIYQNVGLEKSIPATKTFISQVAILLQLALMGNKKNASLHESFKKLPNLMEKILERQEKIRAVAEKYKSFDKFFILGAGFNFPVALEGALKFKEAAGILAEGMLAGELKHGPITLVDKSSASLLIMPKDLRYWENLSLLLEIKKNGGPVVAITTEGNKDLDKIIKDVIYIPKTEELLYPFLATLVLQFLAYSSGVLRGYNVDKPRNLSKAVRI